MTLPWKQLQFLQKHLYREYIIGIYEIDESVKDKTIFAKIKKVPRNFADKDSSVAKSSEMDIYTLQTLL